MKMIEARADAKLGGEQKKFSMHALGSQFAEVRVNPDSGEVRVTRWVGSFGVGRISTPKQPTVNSSVGLSTVSVWH